MKKKLTALVLAAAFCASLLFTSTLTTGCTTVQQGTNTVKMPNLNVITNTINIVVPAVVRLATKDPQAAAALQKAVTLLNLFAQGNVFDPDALNKVITQAGVREIKTPEVLAAIDMIASLYSYYYGDVTQKQLDQLQWVLPVIQALSNSIQKGLTMPPAAELTPQERQSFETAVKDAKKLPVRLFVVHDSVIQGR